MNPETITFLIGSIVTAYAIGWSWGAGMLYFKQFVEKI